MLQASPAVELGQIVRMYVMRTRAGQQIRYSRDGTEARR